jgi:hypothetical protein
VNDILRTAADRAGVDYAQAEALIKELRNPTAGMVNDGDVSIPPFSWTAEEAPRFREVFPGWEGLTSGEFNGTRAAVIWRAICDGLLNDTEVHGWEHKLWPHPKVTEFN